MPGSLRNETTGGPGEELPELPFPDALFLAKQGKEAVVEEWFRGSLPALHAFVVRHPLRGFLSKTPMCLQRFSASGSMFQYLKFQRMEIPNTAD